MQSISLRSFLRPLLLATLIAPSLLHAATDGNPSLDFSDGWNAFAAGRYQKAIAIWSALAEQDHTNAQVNLGFIYDHGTGVPQNHQLAARWYRAAALKGNAVGQYNLSLLIAEGHTIPSTGRSARYWLEQSATQGFADALQALGDNEAATNPGRGDQTERLPGLAEETNTGFEQTKAFAAGVPVSIGTAWPVAAGYAVTNHHIIDGRRQIRLINRHGEELVAEVIVSDATHDIAFLHVSDAKRLPAALPLSSRSAPLGASVFTIGFPRIDVMGRNPKLSQGIISGANGLRDDPGSYQISVPIQPGNSGGPLLNMRGEVVGMITSMLGRTGVGDHHSQAIPNINYALKIDVIREFLAQVPQPSGNIHELSSAVSNLENLAARIQHSVLIVMAE